MKNQKEIKLSRFSCNKHILQTEPKERKTPLFELNVGDRLVLTREDLDTRQKLSDFISDKSKLSLKSFFDHKGSKAFLNGKNEALQRIELNEDIEENIKKKKSSKKNKNIKYRRSADLDYNSSRDMLIKEDTTKKNKCQKHKSTIKRMLSKSPKNKFFKIKEKFQDF